MAFEMCLRRIGRDDIKVHGFRSTFRDWAEEWTNFKRNEIEFALAHKVKDKVEEGFLRTRLFTQRIPLMDAWAAFVMAKPAQKVMKMRQA